MLIERYMIEIAKSYNVPFEPDPHVMREVRVKDFSLTFFFLKLMQKDNRLKIEVFVFPFGCK